MKVKFTKLAALLLAGAALFATGCTDYEVDIQKVDKKVDELAAGRVATLEGQVQALQATVATLETKADHDADIAALNKTISELQKALTEDLDAAKARIAALEAADETFKQQIKALQDTDKDHAQAIELINGEIAGLKTRLDAAEAAIKEIKETLIPAIQAQIKNLEEVVIPKVQQDIADLQSGKLDKSEFKEYKEATAQTLATMQEAIKALTALTAGFPEDTTIKEYIDKAVKALADDVLAKYVELVKKVFGTEQAMNEMEGNLLGRLEACEALLAGDWGDKTVKEYLASEVDKLQKQIDDINNNKLPELDKRLTAVEKNVNEVILPQLEFALDYEGYYTEHNGLQGYIEDWAIEAYLDACDYADEWGNFLWDFIDELFWYVTELQQRIQSIVFVPDYDDLKITSNMSYTTQTVEILDEEGEPTGEFEETTIVQDQPTWVTYKILPAKFATYVASYAPYLLQFDVKAVDTRDDEVVVENEPGFEIIGYDYDLDTVDETGEIKFLVQPVNIASAEFAANGIKPVGGVYMTDNTWDVNYRYEDYGLYWSSANIDAGANYYFRGRSDNWVHYVYDIDDVLAFEARTAFAASLRYKYEEDYTAIWAYYDELYPEYGLLWDDDVEFNEVASPYNVLYPGLMEIDVDDYPWKRIDDEDGDGIDDVREFTEEEQHQTLPYSSLRENPIGEKESQDPKGYRVILDQAVPVAIINDKAYGLFPEQVFNGMHFVVDDEDNFYFIPEFTTTFTAWDFDKNTAESIDKENFVVTPAEADLPEEIATDKTDSGYAELEMNKEKTAAERKLAVGNLITGTYTFTNAFGAFDADGDVLITEPQGEISVSAEIVWTYAYDANIDHNRWVKDYKGSQAVESVDGVIDEEGQITYDPLYYARVQFPITIDEEGAKKLKDELAVTIEDFRKATPTSVEVTTTDEDGKEVKVTDLNIERLTIDEDGNFFANIANFEWDKVYTIKAVYNLPKVANITVNGTLTTVDRNRDIIKITLPEYAFDLNGEDYDAQNDQYTSKPQDFLKPLFDAFVAQAIINQNDPVDFEKPEDFKGDGTAGIGGKEGHLTRYVLEDGSLPEGESKYVICGDDYALFYKVTSAQLKEVWKAGDPQVRNVLTFIGQQVEITWPITVNLPGYDFLHLSYYTFNKDKENGNFIQKRDFADNDGSVIWWSQVNPSYFTDPVEAGQEAPAQSDRVSNRYALADYDVAYINLAELCFNVVDENDEIMDDDDIAEANLVVKFIYTDDKQGDKDLPDEDIAVHPDNSYLLYNDLWVDNTTFYYLTNEKKFIPTLGTLGILSGETIFELPTRFDTPKAAVKYPEEVLDYSTYAVVRWTPFKAPKADGYTIVLDENKIYREPLFKGMFLQDQRPNDVSFYVIKDGEWVVGDAAADATAASKTNGYIAEIPANVAYHITTTFDYSDVNLPAQLKTLLKIQYSADGETFVDEDNEDAPMTPYIVYDYTSEVTFHGVVEIPVVVQLKNPWQEPINFVYSIFIKGYGD